MARSVQLVLTEMVSVKTAFRVGPDGAIAEVEAVKIRALPSLTITGLAGDIVRESRERVLGCLSQLGFADIPSGKVVVHLVPAGEKKQGSHFDLAIALAVLAVENKIPREILSNWGVLGELTLDGRIRSVSGSVALMGALLASGVKFLIVPEQNRHDAALMGTPRVKLANTVAEVIALARGTGDLPSPQALLHGEFQIESSHLELNRLESPGLKSMGRNSNPRAANPFADVVGQSIAKRALAVAVAGRHHTLLVGSPGIGKSILVQAAADLHPRLTRTELIETLRVSDVVEPNLLGSPPFRTPHHSISTSAFLGGGTGQLVPGEVTLAHRGILFLDEFPEFRRDAIEGLREPLETGLIHLHRVGRRYAWPARFTLMAAMNPCPCGHALDPKRTCTCSDEKRLAYSRRISGPILDRMDMRVILKSSDCSGESENYSVVHGDVDEAVERQRHRFRSVENISRNADVNWGSNWSLLQVPVEAPEWIRQLSQQPVNLRAIHKVLRVARTIADLDQVETVKRDQVVEAWQLRCRCSLIQSMQH